MVNAGDNGEDLNDNRSIEEREKLVPENGGEVYWNKYTIKTFG